MPSSAQPGHRFPAPDGHTLLCTADGVDALEILNHETVDLAIVDLEMPKIPGLLFLEEARRATRGRHLQILVLSDESSKEGVTRAIQLGAAEYLLKSQFSPKDFCARMRGCWSTTPPCAGTRPRRPHRQGTPMRMHPAQNAVNLIHTRLPR